MSVFPMFVSLTGKRCVVIGGGKVATRKIETLLKFDATIVVVSPDVSERIQTLKWENRVVVLKKKYSEDDIEGAFLVMAATSDNKVNAKVYEDAERNNIFVNVADDPQKCTFIFPSVVHRGDLVIGISTSGTYPAMSKRIRQKVDEVIPGNFEYIMDILKSCRLRAEKEVAEQAKRQELLNKLLDEVLFYEDAITRERMEMVIDQIFDDYR